MKLRALRDFDYHTRRLKAGDTFDARSRQDFENFKNPALGLAEDVTQEEQPTPRPAQRRRRLPKSAKSLRQPKEAAVEAQAEPEPEPEPQTQSEPEPVVEQEEQDKPLEDHTRQELKTIAKEHDIELPRGYIRHETLVDLIKPELNPEKFGEDDRD